MLHPVKQVCSQRSRSFPQRRCAALATPRARRPGPSQACRDGWGPAAARDSCLSCRRTVFATSLRPPRAVLTPWIPPSWDREPRRDMERERPPASPLAASLSPGIIQQTIISIFLLLLDFHFIIFQETKVATRKDRFRLCSLLLHGERRPAWTWATSCHPGLSSRESGPAPAAEDCQQALLCGRPLARGWPHPTRPRSTALLQGSSRARHQSLPRLGPRAEPPCRQRHPPAFAVSVCHSQLPSEHIQWKIPEIHNF